MRIKAVGAAGRLPLSVDEQAIDLLTLSSNDLYGPPGAGALWARPSAVSRPLRTAPPGLSDASSTTTLTSSLNPAQFAQSVTLKATVTSGATGSVQFLDASFAEGSKEDQLNMPLHDKPADLVLRAAEAFRDRFVFSKKDRNAC